MALETAVVARGHSDRDDRLTAADEPLSALQAACGGELPGGIAIPALLELVRKARSHRMRLARSIRAQDAANAITAWVEAVPQGDGCAITISNWRATPLGADPGAGAIADPVLGAIVAELYARLDAQQAVQAADARCAELARLAEAMRAGLGRPWTDFVEIVGSGHRQPLHWRLLDRAEVAVEGVSGRWRARLTPRFGAGQTLVGFDFHLVPLAVAETPAAVDDRPEPSVASALGGVMGRQLGPLLRQPIGRIVANAETIRTRLAGPLAEEYSAYAADIADAGRHLLELVEDIADLDAIEAPGFAPAPDPIDLAEAARRAAGILGVRARERSIEVRVPPATISVPAVGEHRRVLQVLLNLLGNALRYAPEGSRVRLIAEPRGRFAAITVADEGPGLDPEQQRRVFDKFERLGRSGDGGTGLGLYISRRLARAMGGELELDSAPGEGARFTLLLPVREA